MFTKYKNIIIKLLLLALWFLLVLYPNPGNLAASVYRLQNPPVMPLKVSDFARQLEGSSPDEIKQFVYTQIPYRYDWEVYNMPWYFPTLDEALQHGSGDCKARYLLFASLLEELAIPYYKSISLTHIWVGYEEKPENALENLNESLLIVDESGQTRFKLPRPDLRRSTQSFYRGFWEVMPTGRKLLLLAGFPVVGGLFYLPVVPFCRSLPAIIKNRKK